MTFLDANHCPGAAMILFEPPGRPPVLHSGDFRRALAHHSLTCPVLGRTLSHHTSLGAIE